MAKLVQENLVEYQSNTIIKLSDQAQNQNKCWHKTMLPISLAIGSYPIIITVEYISRFPDPNTAMDTSMDDLQFIKNKVPLTISQ